MARKYMGKPLKRYDSLGIEVLTMIFGLAIGAGIMSLFVLN